ncbi:MAG: hypothetical protein NC210_08110 [[Clostridium] fimetarium]|nr:hypothetical protein [Alistipes timonensis]MCM1406368.1 hypothetical protein [[Clostridium] fimetarium]
MEFKKFIGAALMALAIGGGFASCSSDDDDKESTQTLATPKYEEDAALFVIDTPSSPYGSVELTAAGYYIVTPSGYVNNAPAKKAMLKAASRTVQIYEGKYTKQGDNTYVLDGFGTITVTMDGETAASLDFSLDNGRDFTLKAERQTQYADSKMTNNLCRSWEISRFRLTMKLNGRKLFDKEVAINNLKELYDALHKADPDWEPGDDDDMDFSEMPHQVIFTKAGTYMVKYTDQSLAVSTWGWEDPSKGLLRYSWDYEHLYDPDESGVVTISFPGNGVMKLSESYIEEDDEDRYVETGTWTLRQI